MEFNGLPALSNGYIVDGLETNDPLTNLNSGLSTNLVLGLNSIAEVTVNTLSYAVDQGRYGASQVNYVTKSGTNQFTGIFTSSGTAHCLTPRISSPMPPRATTSRVPRSTTSAEAWAVPSCTTSCSSFSIVSGCGLPSDRHRNNRAYSGIRELCSRATTEGGHRLHYRISLSAVARNWFRFINGCFRYIGTQPELR